MKWLFDSLPFIEPYPTWVKALLSVWLIFSAVCIAALLVTQPAKRASAEENAWLRISEVKFSDRSSVPVRVYAKVNGTTYTYPSVGGVQWVETGPRMAAGTFKITAAETYILSFSMETDQDMRFASQETVILKKSDLPAPRDYRLYVIKPSQTRAPDPTAAVSFILSNSSD
jgi:hypothetical protein